MLDTAIWVPTSWASVGDVVASTVMVTDWVAAAYTWSLNGTQALPFHQSIDWPSGPRSEMVMVNELNALPGVSATSKYTPVPPETVPATGFPE